MLHDSIKVVHTPLWKAIQLLEQLKAEKGEQTEGAK